MKYKDYEAMVEFDEEDRVFHGRILNVKDVISFEGSSVEELEQALRDSVDDYLAFCEERGEAPDKPFSGKFIVRISPALHRDLFIKAQKEKLSLNAFIGKKLSVA